MSRVALCLTVLLALWLRRPDLFALPQFWAEDGTLFYDQALMRPLGHVFVPYSGYLHVLPRLVAALAVALPVAWAPAIFLAAAVIATLGVVLYLSSARVPLPFKPVLALAIVVAPHQGEVFANLTNMQWLLALLFPLIAIADEPLTHAERAIDVITLAAISFTGPFAIFFSPLLAWRFWQRRTGFSLLLLVIVVAIALIQLQSIQTERVPGAFSIFRRGWLRYAGEGISGLFLFARSEIVQRLSADQLAGLSGVLFGGLSWLAWRDRDTRRGTFLLAAATIFLCSAFAFRGNPDALLGQMGGRYYYLPMVLLTWALITSWRWQTWPLAPVLFVSWSFSFANYRTPPLDDLHWSAASRCIKGPAPCDVPINPRGWIVRYRGPGVTSP